MSRTLAPRRTVPSVTRQPAILPTLEMLKISQDLGVAEQGLAQHRRQHARTRLLDVVHEVVDDVVVADLDAVALGQLARLLVGADIEADDRRAGGLGQHDVASLMPPTPARMMRARDFVGAELVERADDRLDRALHIGLDEQRKLLAVLSS